MFPRISAAFAIATFCVCGQSPQPVLWEHPSPQRLHSLAHGPGGPGGQPRPPFRFLKEDSSGRTPKVWVKDAAGKTWIAKWGVERHADIFGARLAWALGYYASPIYYVARGRIIGDYSIGRAASAISANGEFEHARFEQVQDGVQYIGEGWRWDRHPFTRTPRQINGLKILLILLSNWDAKDAGSTSGSNTSIFRKRTYDYYAVDDWGASLGKWGHWPTRRKWDCEAYTAQTAKFIKEIDASGEIHWGFVGINEKALTTGITTADVKWFLIYLSQITDADLTQGLRASGASPDDVGCFVPAVRARINQLRRIRNSNRNHGRATGTNTGGFAAFAKSSVVR